MTTEEKIQKILNNADTCRWRIEQILARVSDPSAPLSGGVAEWLRKIGIDDQRIEPALDESLSPEARIAMFRGLQDKYKLSATSVAAILQCSTALIASYRNGRRTIPIERLLLLETAISGIDAARSRFHIL